MRLLLRFPGLDQAGAECNVLAATHFLANILMDERLRLRLYSSVSLTTLFTHFYLISLQFVDAMLKLISLQRIIMVCNTIKCESYAFS